MLDQGNVNVETNAETLHYHFDKRNLRNLRTGRNPRTKAELKTMPAEGSGGSNSTQTRIVGGTGAPQGKYPYFLQWAWGCGATLIHSDILLTAAQCDGRNIPTTVIVGAYQNGQATLEPKLVKLLSAPGTQNAIHSQM